MRLSARRSLTIGLALLAGGAMAGCSGAQGLAFANGTTRPAASATAAAPTVAAPAALASPTMVSPAPSPAPAGDLVVTGAPRGVLAKSGVLVDASTGQVLWDRGMNAARPMASITKVMTAYLVIGAGNNVDRRITIPRGVLDYVAKYGASSDSLKPGEVLTVRQLLYGLLLESGADAAYTLAAAYGPGLSAFIAKMNVTAQQLGMTHTRFTSPDGLPYPTETSTYSTPADLVILGETAMKSSLFRAIVDQRFVNLGKGQGHADHWWGNSNWLIGRYPGAVGIKTGYTDVALHCLLFEAVRNGRTLIGVVLGSPATGPQAGAQDAARVLDWGFALKKA
jgi:serine-type D-Ala-D-Ala carboxypeptidase (penicillin-binding protein 5/6)